MQLFNRYCELVNYRLTEVCRFTWTCFGDTAYYFSNWDQTNDTYSLQAIVDLRTFDVKVLGVWRQVMKRVVSGYDKKRLDSDGITYIPKKMIDIGAELDDIPLV
ncbi:MAG: hypothetical protein EBT15_10320 [Betaproteobacteria bacterium]|nr:hypothetical protein [Betaproteobacteria bacterium]